MRFRTSTRLAGAAAVLALGLTGTAVGTAEAAAPAASAASAASTFTCATGDLCIHYKVASGTYYWKSLYVCQTWSIPGVATWFDNNQTGSRITPLFYYPDGATWSPSTTSGRPMHYPYDTPQKTAPTKVRNCY